MLDRKFSLIASLVALAGCRSESEPNRRAILPADLISATVGFVAKVEHDDGSTTEEIVCAGAWIDDRTIATAKHCVAASMPELYRLFMANEPVDLLNVPMRLQLREDGPVLEARSLSVSEDDVALVQCAGASGQHGAVKVRSERASVGERVSIVGHPASLLWSYSEGYVSAVRSMEDPFERSHVDTYQISAPLSAGSSGGGAFDRAGELLGITSFIYPDTPGIAFFATNTSVIDLMLDAGSHGVSD